MVIQAQPVMDAYDDLKSKGGAPKRLIYLTPQGKTFNQKKWLRILQKKMN